MENVNFVISVGSLHFSETALKKSATGGKAPAVRIA
jgi:hypothetical protein